MKFEDIFLCSLFIILVADVTNSVPVQFPGDVDPSSSSSRSLQSDLTDFGDDEARFHHHKQKKKKKKKLACLLAHHHNRQKRSPENDGVDPRTLWWGAVNYYDTDVFYYGGGGSPNGGYPYQQESSGNPCQHMGLGASSHGLGSQIINVVGGLPGFGGNSPGNIFPSLGGLRPPSLPSATRPPILPVRPVVTRPPAPVRPPPAVFTTSTTLKPPTAGGGGSDGDNTDEDYDYSEGYPSTNTYSRPITNRPPRRRPTRPRPSSSRPRPGPVVATLGDFGDLISSVPAAAGTVISSFGSGVRPVFKQSERYIDDYVVKPLNDSVKQLVRWFR